MKNKYYKPFIPHTEARELYKRKGNKPCSEAEALLQQITIELSIGQVDNASEHVAELLEVDGRFFAHVFSHKTHRYTFEAETDGWMARWFFSGGTMPNLDHLTRASTKLRPMDRWIINGRHYADTLRAWLQNLDSNRQDVLDIFRDLYGPRNAALWLVRWRLFFIACQELFDFRKGTEWVVAHHLFEPTRR